MRKLPYCVSMGANAKWSMRAGQAPTLAVPGAPLVMQYCSAMLPPRSCCKTAGRALAQHSLGAVVSQSATSTTGSNIALAGARLAVAGTAPVMQYCSAIFPPRSCCSSTTSRLDQHSFDPKDRVQPEAAERSSVADERQEYGRNLHKCSNKPSRILSSFYWPELGQDPKLLKSVKGS